MKKRKMVREKIENKGKNGWGEKENKLRGRGM
jgi:hypothetical protein